MPFVIAFASALVLTPLAGWVGRAAGLVDRPGADLKIHERAVPTLGGAAVLAAVAIALAAGSAWPPWGAVAAVFVALVAGTVDDRWAVPASLRAILVAAAGGLLVVGSPLAASGVVAVVGVVLLVLASANAVNIMDGQDALAGGLAALAAGGMAAVGWVGEAPASALGMALPGALLGFMDWNRPPARVFLGNGGAYAVGVLLAVQATGLTLSLGLRGLLAAGACMSVFAFELAFTVGRRIASGGGLGVGDRLHSYDLVAAARGRAVSTLFFLGLGVLAAGFGILAVFIPLWVFMATGAAASAIAALWATRLWEARPVVAGRSG
jgi:UDP-GlcNAc:undecaprenyl-phosphate GlcNAc-1-phosphate transferase